MSESNSSWDELARGVDRAACERHKFIVPRTTAHVLTLDDSAFGAASPVLLPAPANAKLQEGGGVITGLSIIAQALTYAAAHSDQKLTVFAHCEPLGSAASEAGISELRAQNVLAYLQGQRDAFAAGCAAHVLEDVLRVRDWAQHRGVTWPANGGDEGDWKVAFDLYDQQLAVLLGAVDLDAARSKLSFGDPGKLGCGAFWPKGGGSRAASQEASVVKVSTSRARSHDTRVDLLFAEPDVRLPAQPSDQAPGVRIFLDQRFVLRDVIEPEAKPAAVCVRMTGMHFDTSKCFLLPGAIPGIRTIKATYDAHPDSNLLVVGHTDTAGSTDSNMTLSLERADAVAAYLTDQTRPWEAFFDAGKPDEKRWGTREVQSMLATVPEPGNEFYQGPIDGIDGPQTQDAVRAFQTAEGLKVDGVAGPLTRKAVITKYMAQDATSLPAGITLTTQGAGESFPAEATGDGVANPHNRRVELFFFDRPIAPAPPADQKSSQGSSEYPAWLAQVIETILISVENPEDLPEAAIIGLHPPLFDTIPDGATLTLTPTEGPVEVFPLSSGIDLGDGLLHFVVEAPKPGMLYTAEVRLADNDTPSVLFSDFELHQLVAERQGAAAAEVPALGGDALVFDSEADQPSDGDPTEGGPLETSDDQLAQFNAHAGTVALA